MKIVIDVDETVTTLARQWLYWLEQVSSEPNIALNINFETDKDIHYNLSKYYKDVLPTNLNGEEFWETCMYSTAEPFPYAFYYINKLREEGNTIIFVSACKAGHRNSKIKWLKKHFTKDIAFIDTEDKEFVMGDVYVDDRHQFLNKYPKDKLIIKMDSPYTQAEELTRTVITCANWEEIYQVIKEYLTTNK